MIEQILPEIYKLEIPIPNDPLKATNSYLVKGPERNLLIDTGFTQRECLNSMNEALTKLRVDMTKTDIFITHFHSDHIGLVPQIVTETTEIYFNRPESDWLKKCTQVDDSLAFMLSSGWPDKDMAAVHSFYRNRENNFRFDLNFRILSEKDKLKVGDYSFECIETPGHSKGHICLYEPVKKLFFAGDHLLKKITPGIMAMWSYEWDPLEEYLTSLDKVGVLDIDLVLPGHAAIFENYRERIAEIKSHHDRRLNEVIAVVSQGKQTAYQIGSKLTWDVSYDSWNDFPVMLRLLAVNETMSHLRYLENRKQLRKRIVKGCAFYSSFNNNLTNK